MKITKNVIVENKMRTFIYILIIFFSIETFAQKGVSEKIKPQWLHKLPHPSNPTFRYETYSSTSNTLDGAREKCLAELISASGMKNGVVVISNYKSEEQLSQHWNNGKLEEKLDYKNLTNTEAKGKEVKLYVENIAEYWERNENGQYFLTKLYAKSELENPPLFDEVELTTKYGAHGLWRSAIVPGWGQLYKGSKVKGGCIMGGCAALIAGIIVTENQRSVYSSKITKTHSAELKRSYANKADNMAIGRNIFIGATAALYIYNLVDAIVAPGARRVVVKKRDGTNRVYSFSPVVTPMGDAGLSASVEF